MMCFVVEHGLRPVVGAVLPSERCAEAFALMERGAQCGKVVPELVGARFKTFVSWIWPGLENPSILPLKVAPSRGIEPRFEP